MMENITCNNAEPYGNIRNHNEIKQIIDGDTVILRFADKPNKHAIACVQDIMLKSLFNNFSSSVDKVKFNN